MKNADSLTSNSNPLSESRVIYLIEDDDDCRSNIAQFLNLKGYQVFSYPAADGFLREALVAPAVLVSDMQMPGLTGVDVQTVLIERGVEMPMIFISGESTFQQAVQAMKQGAAEFLAKPVSPEELLLAIERAFEKLSIEAATYITKLSLEVKLQKLSPRERMVYDLLREGFSNPQLVDRMGISMPTVKEYKANVFRKLEIEHLSELMKLH